MTEKPAAGVTGILIKDINGQFRFRIYDENHNFIDYEIRHYDLKVTIDPNELATFYEFDNGDAVLDYSWEVLKPCS